MEARNFSSSKFWKAADSITAVSIQLSDGLPADSSCCSARPRANSATSRSNLLKAASSLCRTSVDPSTELVACATRLSSSCSVFSAFLSSTFMSLMASSSAGKACKASDANLSIGCGAGSRPLPKSMSSLSRSFRTRLASRTSALASCSTSPISSSCTCLSRTTTRLIISWSCSCKRCTPWSPLSFKGFCALKDGGACAIPKSLSPDSRADSTSRSRAASSLTSFVTSLSLASNSTTASTGLSCSNCLLVILLCSCWSCCWKPAILASPLESLSRRRPISSRIWSKLSCTCSTLASVLRSTPPSRLDVVGGLATRSSRRSSRWKRLATPPKASTSSTLPGGKPWPSSSKFRTSAMSSSDARRRSSSAPIKALLTPPKPACAWWACSLSPAMSSKRSERCWTRSLKTASS
mmetsp:Transcript_74761/g.177866  ORF Transcript_74761/g.177866 Transcript_74761/m.177866 type:complete len:409 (-) Transcript_74761:898-2124(-)